MLSKTINKKTFSSSVTLLRTQNQAIELAKYAKDFLENGNPSQETLERTKLFHTDSVLCGISALAMRTNAPSVLKNEAMQYQLKNSGLKSREKGYARCLGSKSLTLAEKAICANASAVREWDSNGTVFGYRDGVKGHQAGEFGHNDFYPVSVAAA